MFTTVFLIGYSNAYSYARTLVHTCTYSSGTIKELKRHVANHTHGWLCSHNNTGETTIYDWLFT